MLAPFAGSFPLLIWGCGESQPGSHSQPEIDDFTADYVAAVCKSAQRCCPDNPNVPSFCAGDLGSLGFHREAAAANRYTFRPETAQRCLEAISSMEICDERWPVVCSNVFEGTLEPGEPCNTDIECRAPMPMAAPLCALDDGVMRCVGALELGDPCKYLCDLNGVCALGGPGTGACYLATGLYCSLDSGTCEALLEPGDSCTSSSWCDGGSCAGPTCVALVPLGGACDSAPCAPELRCVDGSCAPRLPTGEACADDGRSCASGRCEAGRCLASTPLCPG